MGCPAVLRQSARRGDSHSARRELCQRYLWFRIHTHLGVREVMVEHIPGEAGTGDPRGPLRKSSAQTGC
jgi:hypothetical protein